MSNFVLKYSRDDRVKYISHLDFMRMFHRAARRSGLDMTFSQGFNPHPVMTVACPLSVGITSDGEYMKIGFEGDITAEEIMKKLNDVLPPGFHIRAAQKVEGKELDFSKIDRARYLIKVELKNTVEFNADNFLENDELIVPKKTKSGVKETNIRSLIYHIKMKENKDNYLVFTAVIAAGNNGNLKPETLIEAMEKYIQGFKAEFFTAHRISLLAGRKEYLSK